MIRKSFYKKIFVGAAVLFLIFVPVGTITKNEVGAVSDRYSSSFGMNVAFAQTSIVGNIAGTVASSPNLLNCLSGGSPATCGVYFISYAVNDIVALGVNLGASLVRFGLQLNNNVFNSPAVMTGFSVMLAIANLGFVLCIIIIALATIIRNQTYGMKQLLWKLVVMAILVNFGLVITAPIVGFANSMSNYFVSATSPNSSATDGYETYVTTITNAFAPQAVNNNAPASAGSTNTSGTACAAAGASGVSGAVTLCNILATVATRVVGSPDVFVQQLNAMFFGIVFSSLTAWTFLCLGILLFVRYLMLAGLLIVLPLAWLTFILPKYDSNFSKWWTVFIKWTLFPPIALFFIYLAMITISNIPGTANVSGTSYINSAASVPAGATNGPEGALVYQTGLGGPIQNALDEYLLVGLVIMGLFFANSLTGKAGTAVVDGAAHASKVVSGYVGKKGKRWVGDRARTAGRKYNPDTKETTSALQRFGANLQGVPLLKRPGSILSNYAAPKAVHEERKEDIKKYTAENLANLPNDGIVDRANSATALLNPTVAAAIAEQLAKRDLTNRVSKKRLDDLIGYAEDMGTAEVVFNNRPDLMEPRMLAANPATGTAARMETKEEAVARAVKASKGDVINISAQVFNSLHPAAAADKLGSHVTAHPGMLERAVLALNSSQLGTLGSDPGSAERKTYITETIKHLVDTLGLKKEIMKKELVLDPATGIPEKDPRTGKPTGRRQDVGTNKFEIDEAALKTAIASRKELEGLKDLINHMEHSSNWVSPLQK